MRRHGRVRFCARPPWSQRRPFAANVTMPRQIQRILDLRSHQRGPESSWRRRGLRPVRSRNLGTSGRFTLVNGLLQPVLSLGDNPAGPVVNATVGRPERWRIIHAGVRDTIKLAIVRAMQPRPSGAAFAMLEQRRGSRPAPATTRS